MWEKDLLIGRVFHKLGLCPVLGWDVAETDIYQQRPNVIGGTEMPAIETGDNFCSPTTRLISSHLRHSLL